MRRIAIAAIAAGAALCAAAASATELKLAHFMSPQHPMDRHVMTPLAEEIAAKTNGALTIKVYPAGELGAGPNQQYRRAVTGIADIAFNLPQYTPAQFQRSVMLHVPGLFADPESATATIWDNIDALDGDFEQVELLAFWTNNPSILFSRETPVRSLADVSGLKVRIPDPVTASIVEAWGGIPVSLPATEVYNAMSTGVVDAVMIDASAVGSYNLHEVAKHVTTNVPGALSTFTLIMNRGAYDKLSDEQRAALDDLTGRDLSMRAATAFKAAGDRGIAMLREANVELITLEPDARAAFVAAMAAPIAAELKAQGEAVGLDGEAFLARFAAAN
ncbi:TRAP transporter substrate-binding protein [Salinarimonas rosea]|uniref:TRAP transporter substrate-binding protein n=1 Tax=Salinarimonas rosea TaxID=552063 RepID=UPI00040FAC05|nr:TRAP transporter substrate-binding protein [Salinarimonas rosea]